jgi:hypothetical protein
MGSSSATAPRLGVPRPLLTTTEAAVYCGFKNPSGLRKAHLEGRIFSVGRRGGIGPWMWAISDRDRFLRGEGPVRSSAERSGAPPQQEKHMRKQKDWKLKKGVWISMRPVLPGVWQRKDGGHLVKGRAIESTTGKTKEIFRVLPDADVATALKWLRDEQVRVRAGVDSAPTPKLRFSTFANELFERNVKAL